MPIKKIENGEQIGDPNAKSIFELFNTTQENFDYIESILGGVELPLFPNVVNTNQAGIKIDETPTYEAPSVDGKYYPQSAATYSFDNGAGGTVDIVVSEADLTNAEPVIFKFGNLYQKKVTALGFEVPEVVDPVALDEKAVEGEPLDAKSAYDTLNFQNISSEIDKYGFYVTGGSSVNSNAGFAYVPFHLLADKKGVVKKIFIRANFSGTANITFFSCNKDGSNNVTTNDLFSPISLTGSYGSNFYTLDVNFTIENGEYLGFYLDIQVANLINLKASGDFGNVMGWYFNKTAAIPGNTTPSTAEAINRHFQIAMFVEDYNQQPNVVPNLPQIGSTGGVTTLNANLPVAGAVNAYSGATGLIVPAAAITRQGIVNKVRFYNKDNVVKTFRVARYLLDETNLNGQCLSVSEEITTSDIRGWSYHELQNPLNCFPGEVLGLIGTNANSINFIDEDLGAGIDYQTYTFAPNISSPNKFYSLSNQNARGTLVEFIQQPSGTIPVYASGNMKSGMPLLDEKRRLGLGVTPYLNTMADEIAVWGGTSVPFQNTPEYPSYPQILGELFNIKMINNSYSSSFITKQGNANGLSSTEAEFEAVAPGTGFASYEKSILGLGAKYFFLDHLINDVLNYWATPATATSANGGDINSTDRRTLYGAYNTVISGIYTENPYATIFIVSPPNRFDSPISPRHTYANFDEGFTILKNIAKKWNAVYVPLGEYCNVNNFTKDFRTRDLLHPEYSENIRIANLIASLISPYFQ